MGYAHKVSEKITLASDFLWHWQSREATATVGFDCMLRQCRLRGKIDTNGVVSTYVEERFAPGINFVLSAEIDHPHGNHRCVPSGRLCCIPCTDTASEASTPSSNQSEHLCPAGSDSG